MIDDDFVAYRAVATVVEDVYFELVSRDNNKGEQIEYLLGILSKNPTLFWRVCALRLLGHEIAKGGIERNVYSVGFRSAKQLYDELYRIDYFDPLAINDCASYYLLDVEDLQKSREIALYGSFIAERSRVYVRLSHQLLLKIAYQQRDLCAAEVSIRRIIEYVPDIDSPDPAIESDVVLMVGKLPIDPTLKAAFFQAVSNQNR